MGRTQHHRAAAGQHLEHPRVGHRRAQTVPAAFPSPLLRLGAGAPVSARVTFSPMSGVGAVPPPPQLDDEIGRSSADPAPTR